MDHAMNTRTLWSKAAVSGAALGIFSGIFIFLSAGGIKQPVLSGIVSFVLWAVKFAGCIWLMQFFMKRLCREYGSATNADTFKFGTMAAFLSALIFSAIYLANVLFISPDIFSQQMESVMQMYSSMLDSNSMAMLEKMEDSFPQISFFSNLIYCFLFGLVLSAILSRNIPKRDLFADFRNGDGREELQQGNQE